MIKLKIQKNKISLNLIIPHKIKNKVNIPTCIGLTKHANYSLINYYLIIILQKYGFTISKGLNKFFITKVLKS